MYIVLTASLHDCLCVGTYVCMHVCRGPRHCTASPSNQWCTLSSWKPFLTVTQNCKATLVAALVVPLLLNTLVRILQRTAFELLTLNPKPPTLNPKPQTLNPKPVNPYPAHPTAGSTGLPAPERTSSGFLRAWGWGPGGHRRFANVFGLKFLFRAHRGFLVVAKTLVFGEVRSGFGMVPRGFVLK